MITDGAVKDKRRYDISLKNIPPFIDNSEKCNKKKSLNYSLHHDKFTSKT